MEAAVCILFSPDRKAVCLIQRRDVPVWVLPGGGIEPGESPEEGALREMEEETGYKVSLVRKIAQYSPANRLSKTTHFFEVQMISGAPTTGKETRNIDFFPLNHLPKHVPPPYPYWIQDAVGNQGKTLYKKVEGTSYWTLLKLLFQHPILVGRFLLTTLGIHINSR